MSQDKSQPKSPPQQSLRPATQLVTGGRDRETFEFVNPPIVRGSTVLHQSVADMQARLAVRSAGADEPITYGIYGGPTQQALYDALNALEGGHRSWAFPSGLTACAIAIQAFVKAGDHVLMPDTVYWPVRRYCRETLASFGVSTTFYDPSIGAEIERLFTPKTRLLWLESPGSDTFEMQDVPLLAAIARAKGAVSAIDNTWATPLHFQPLKVGVDISIHAVTKYIGGHSDLLMGTVTSNERTWLQLRQTIYNYGLTTSADDCALALRGLRSMGARLVQHEANARTLIGWFKAQPEVERVLYPGDANDPGYALWKRDMTGACGLFGVLLKPGIAEEKLHAFIDTLQLFGRGYSWGGFESLLIACFPERTVTPNPYIGRLFRVHAGLEDTKDLIADLERGFGALRG